MASRALVSIYRLSTGEWIDLPTPYDYDASSSTLVNSARNSEGVVIGDVIKEDVAKVEMTWKYLTVKQYSDIAKLFDSKYGGAFFNYVSFFDVIKGDWNGDTATAPSSVNPCKVMYVNDRKVKFAHITLDSNGKPIGYENVSLHLIDTGGKEI